MNKLLFIPLVIMVITLCSSANNVLSANNGFQSEKPLNFSEILLSCTFENLTLSLSMLGSSNSAANLTDSSYLLASYDFRLPHEVNLTNNTVFYKIEVTENYQHYDIELGGVVFY